MKTKYKAFISIARANQGLTIVSVYSCHKKMRYSRMIGTRSRGCTDLYFSNLYRLFKDSVSFGCQLQSDKRKTHPLRKENSGMKRVIITILIFFIWHRLRLRCIFYAQNGWKYEKRRTKKCTAARSS